MERVQFILKNLDDDQSDMLNIEGVSDRSDFYANDGFGGKYHFLINGDEVKIVYDTSDHKTTIYIGNDPYLCISSAEGDFSFPIKVIEKNIKHDNISIVYCMDDRSMQIMINYL